LSLVEPTLPLPVPPPPMRNTTVRPPDWRWLPFASRATSVTVADDRL
jgi:hypothetical protein